MKKITTTLVCILSILGAYKYAHSEDLKPLNAPQQMEYYIHQMYKTLNTNGGNSVDEAVFAQALRGYWTLRNEGKLNIFKETLTICDFNLPSTQKRMWIIDIKQNKVLYNTYVAHGAATGEDVATCFSNDFDSHKSSLGFYVTAQMYNGDKGLSLKLEGLDTGYNDHAYDRGIVIHGAKYVDESYIACNQRLGRSWGCPAISESIKKEVIELLAYGTCVYIAQNNSMFTAQSCWLNKAITQLPETFSTPEKGEVLWQHLQAAMQEKKAKTPIVAAPTATPTPPPPAEKPRNILSAD